jgi:hypothetical protein
MAVRDMKELTVYIKWNSEVGKMLRSIHDQPEKFLAPST